VRDKLITLGLFVIMTLNMMDVATDIQLKVPTWHIIEEAFIVLLSASMALFLTWEMHKRTQSLKRVSNALKQHKQQLSIINAQFEQAQQTFALAISIQFEQWQLTNSEQEVALMLLKGYSLQEISDIRDTKEKTVRQQASTIYSKAEMEGRHALSAHFLDMAFSQRVTE